MLKFIEYPKCSTCKKAKKYLDDLGLEHSDRHIVEEKLNKEELRALYKKSGDAIEIAIREVEDFPYYKSVGYGGLPNEDMEVELDAAFMDGDTLDIGAVAAIKDFANPISIAPTVS